MHFRGASTSTYVDRVLGEQAAIESRLVELVGVEVISSGLKDATIKSEEHMKVDVPPEPPVSRAIAAKQTSTAPQIATGGHKRLAQWLHPFSTADRIHEIAITLSVNSGRLLSTRARAK